MSKQTTVQSGPVTQVAIIPVAPVEQPFSLGETIKSVKKQLCSMKKQVVQSDAYKTFDESRQTIGREVCIPVTSAWKNTYKELPLETTKMKFNYIEDFTFKERFLLLNTLTVAGALLTLRKVNSGNVFRKTFNAVRNASLAYIIGGLLIAPEIYNPLMSE